MFICLFLVQAHSGGENAPAVRLMLSCRTQRRTGFAGATGLDYNALFRVAGAPEITVDAGMKARDAAEASLLPNWGDKGQ